LYINFRPLRRYRTRSLTSSSGYNRLNAFDCLLCGGNCRASLPDSVLCGCDGWLQLEHCQVRVCDHRACRLHGRG